MAVLLLALFTRVVLLLLSAFGTKDLAPFEVPVCPNSLVSVVLEETSRTGGIGLSAEPSLLGSPLVLVARLLSEIEEPNT